MFDVDRDYDYGSYINYKRALTCLSIPKELQCAFIKKNSCTVAQEMKRSILRERARATTLPGCDTAP